MNNKGITLIEIIISIVLISIVLIFLFSLLITVKDINDESEVSSTYLINKSLILKNIENDLNKAETVSLIKCNISEFYSNYDSYKNSIDDNLKANECIKFTFNNDDANVGYLGIYYYKNKESYVISYIHGDVKATRLLPDFELNNVDGTSLKKNWTYNTNTEINDGFTEDFSLKEFHVINIPIIGSDGKDYSINISYYKNA